MKTRKFAFTLLLLAVALAGLLLRYAGVQEPFGLHPDEEPIARWMERMHDSHSLLPKTYPGGFFVLADAVRQLSERLIVQPLHHWQYFIRATDTYTAAPLDVFVFGRRFNVWLGAFVTFLVAWFARRVTRSRAGALTAAALMAFAAFPVEHAHYLETDIAMLATAVLALYLLARHIEKRSPFSLVLAAFATGFAAGTKFPLAILLAPLAASLRLPSRPTGRRHAATWIAALALLAALAALAGFVTACPDARHVSSFLAGLQSGESSVYRETAGILGRAITHPHAREWMNFLNMLRFSRSLGLPWILAAMAGLPLCFLPRLRPFWPVTLLFPLLHLWFIVFHAPWSRSQEFMVFLPNACLWAALPVAALWNAQRRSRLAPAAALLLAAVILLPDLRNGVAMASQFGWEDTRRLANSRLKTCYPRDRLLATEHYTSPAQRNVAASEIGIGKYEKAGPGFVHSNAIDYVLLNTDAHGRGILDPLTGRLFPEYTRNMESLLRHGQCIAAFGSLASPAPQATFRAPALELWSAPDESPQSHEDLGVELPRPSLIQDTGRSTWFLGKLRAGPRFALLLDKHPREIAMGGPGDFTGPVFLVFSTHERAATILARGFGGSHRLELGPYSSGVIPLERPWWNPRWARYERLRLRTETGGPTLTYLPCFLRVAFDPLEAATLLLDDGHPGLAVDLLRDQNALDSAGPFWRALAGDPTATDPAAALLARWEEWLERDPSDPPPVLAGGIRLSTWQDFSRIRLVDPEFTSILPFSIALDSNAARQTPLLASLLPVHGAPQRLDLTLARHSDSFGHTNFSGQVAFPFGDSAPAARFDFLGLPGPRQPGLEWTQTSARLPRLLNLTFQSTSGGAIRLDHAEYTWNWHDMLALRRAQLARALAALASPDAPAPRRYADWVALRSVRVENGHALLELQALQDDVPPLAARLQILRHRHWRSGPPVPVHPALSPWNRGEIRTVRLPLEPGIPPRRIGLALATDVPWHSSLLPYHGAPPHRPFPLLSELDPAP